MNSYFLFFFISLTGKTFVFAPLPTVALQKQTSSIDSFKETETYSLLVQGM